MECRAMNYQRTRKIGDNLNLICSRTSHFRCRPERTPMPMWSLREDSEVCIRRRRETITCATWRVEAVPLHPFWCEVGSSWRMEEKGQRKWFSGEGPQKSGSCTSSVLRVPSSTCWLENRRHSSIADFLIGAHTHTYTHTHGCIHTHTITYTYTTKHGGSTNHLQDHVMARNKSFSA